MVTKSIFKQTTNRMTFCPILADLIETNSITGKNGKEFKNLAALSTANNLLVIRNLMLDLKPKFTLEIGLAFGGSCLTIAATHRDNEVLPNKQHIAIDPYQHSVWDDVGLTLMDQAGLSDYLDFRCEMSSSFLAKMVGDKKQFELIYIDGSHLFEDVFVDYYYSFRLLSEGGVLLFDDSEDKHVKKVLRFIRSSMKEYLSELDLRTYHPNQSTFEHHVVRLLKKTQLTGFKKVKEGTRSWDAQFVNF